ncbi:hypothetical protein ACHAXS_003851 [Conticribra weissflogii]
MTITNRSHTTMIIDPETFFRGYYLRNMKSDFAIHCQRLMMYRATDSEFPRDVNVDSVVAIWVCTDDDHRDDNNSEDKVSNVYFCDKRELKRAAKVEEGFGAVVIDPEAPASLVQALDGEFCKKRDAHITMI